MGEKLKKRTRLYSSFDEFKAVDKKHCIDPATLPKEYGGVVPMREMIGEFGFQSRKIYGLLVNDILQTYTEVPRYKSPSLQGTCFEGDFFAG